VSPTARAVGAVFRFGLFGGPDFFHFHRVDGAYVGAGYTWFAPDFMPSSEPTAKLGYATGSKLWQYRVGDRFQLSDDRRTWIGAVYHDETVSRPTLTSLGYAPTMRALFANSDPLDYFRDRSLRATLTSKLVKFTDVELGYLDARQSSLSTVVDRPPLRFGRDTARMRPNPLIDDGHLRALSAGLTIDSRPLIKQAGRDVRFNVLRYTRFTIGGEWSPRDLSSDFDYRRVTARFDRRQETYGMGITTFVATGGIGTSALPIQRAFIVDGGAHILEALGSPFSTLEQVSFTGSRAAVISIQHDFDRLLFMTSRLPLVRDIPFTLSVNAAAFWSEFPLAGLDSGAIARRQGFNVTRDPYREIGFTVGNLTPFLSIFNFSARFAWQLSRYPTTPFRFSLGLSR
jgi:hypothetical protein